MLATTGEFIEGDGVKLHVVRAGAGPAVILLHGFPESSRSWRRQIPVLAAAGLSVLAPDLRGYGESDKPAGRNAYRLRHLVADVAALVKASGAARAHVVGHDWGGIIAWTFAGMHPELVDRLVIMNAPHPDIYFSKLWRTRQLFRSSYVLLFRIPRVAEWLLSRNDFGVVRHMFRRLPARHATFTKEDVDAYVKALRQPGALTAALDYYRAFFSGDALARAKPSIVTAETLVIWGEQDPALGLELLDGLERVAPRVRVARLPHASHWVQNEAPDEVNRLLVGFLSGAHDSRTQSRFRRACATTRPSHGRGPARARLLDLQPVEDSRVRDYSIFRRSRPRACATTRPSGRPL